MQLGLGTISPDSIRTRVRKSFEESGLRDIFTEDLTHMVDIAEGPEDIKVIGDILRSSLTDSRPLTNFPTLLKWYFSLCKMMNEVELAKDMWNDPEIIKSAVLSSNTSLIYYQLLYENALYNEIVENYENLPERSRGLNELTIAMAALYKIGTKEAFHKATEIMKNDMSRNVKYSSGVRGTYIYAYFAISLGENGIAYDTLCDPNLVGRSNMLRTNLKLDVLIRVGRLEEALLLARTEFLPKRGRSEDSKTRKVCFEVMERFAAAIKESEGSHSDTAKEFAAICTELDGRAHLVEESLEDIIFAPIESRNAKQDRDRRTSRRDRVDEDDEEE